jgi:hypothetical protein
MARPATVALPRVRFEAELGEGQPSGLAVTSDGTIHVMQTRPVLLHSFRPPRFDTAVNTELSLGIASSNVRIAALAPSVGDADADAGGDRARALLFDRAQGKLFAATTAQQRMVMVDLPLEYKAVASYSSRCRGTPGVPPLWASTASRHACARIRAAHGG